MQSHYALLKALGEVKEEKKEDFREALRDQFCHPYSPAVLRSWFCAERAPGWGEPQGSIPKEQNFGGCANFWTMVFRSRLRNQPAGEAGAKPGSDSDMPVR